MLPTRDRDGRADTCGSSYDQPPPGLASPWLEAKPRVLVHELGAGCPQNPGHGLRSSLRETALRAQRFGATAVIFSHEVAVPEQSNQRESVVGTLGPIPANIGPVIQHPILAAPSMVDFYRALPQDTSREEAEQQQEMIRRKQTIVLVRGLPMVPVQQYAKLKRTLMRADISGRAPPHKPPTKTFHGESYFPWGGEEAHICDLVMPMDQSGTRTCGYGFTKFSSAEHAAKACQNADGFRLDKWHTLKTSLRTGYNLMGDDIIVTAGGRKEPMLANYYESEVNIPILVVRKIDTVGLVLPNGVSGVSGGKEFEVDLFLESEPWMHDADWWLHNYDAELLGQDDKLRNGMLPLHAAVLANAPLSVLEALHSKNPAACQTADAYGYLPLHWACESEVSPAAAVEVLRFLLRINPAAARQSVKFKHPETDLCQSLLKDGIPLAWPVDLLSARPYRAQLPLLQALLELGGSEGGEIDEQGQQGGDDSSVVPAPREAATAPEGQLPYVLSYHGPLRTALDCPDCDEQFVQILLDADPSAARYRPQSVIARSSSIPYQLHRERAAYTFDDRYPQFVNLPFRSTCSR